MTVHHDPTVHSRPVADDEMLIARFAVDDVDPAERGLAQHLVGACVACAELLVDLTAISAAMRSLPTPRRTRDFRLTPADADRLRPARVPWRRRLAGALAGPRFGFSSPLAAGLITIGLAGFLVSSAPTMLQPARTIISTIGTSIDQGAPANGAGSDQGFARPSATSAGRGEMSAGSPAASAKAPASSAAPASAPAQQGGFPAPAVSPATNEPSPTPASANGPGVALPVVFLVMLVAGVGLAVVRRFARGAVAG